MPFSWSENLNHLTEQMRNIVLYSWGFLPPGVYAGTGLAAVIVFLLSLKYLRSSGWKILVLTAVAIFGCIFYTIVFQLFIPGPWIIARSVAAISSIHPVLLMIPL